MTRIVLLVSLCVALTYPVFAQSKGSTHKTGEKPPPRAAQAPSPVRRPSQQRRSPVRQATPTSRPLVGSTGSILPPPLYTIDSPSSPTPAKGSTLSHILKNQLLRVCVRADIPPFGHFGNRVLTGFDIQLAREIRVQLSVFYKKNLRISWTVINASSRLSSLKQNNCDMVVAAFSITAKRARLISFSRAYLQTHKVILKKVTITRKLPVIALVRGTTNGQKLNGSVRFFRNYSEIINAMERGEVDYAVTDQPIAVHMLRSVPQPYTIQRVLNHKERYGVGVNKNSKILLQAINKALLALAQTGRLAYLQRQWL